MCACGSEGKTTEPFLLRCHLYSLQRLELIENFEKVDSSFLNLNVKDYINYIKETGRFDGPLFCPNQ